jgi:1,4-dihydroxy-2-naphthoyl-CoA hydrolase
MTSKVGPVSASAGPNQTGDARTEANRWIAALGGTLEGTLIRRLGIEVLEVGPDRVVARMPVAGNVQPFGLLHGGATAALCETVASIGASLAAAPDRTAVGIELNVNHLRAVTEGSVIATGNVLRAGRSIAVWDVRVHDEGGELVAAGRLTLAVRESR